MTRAVAVHQAPCRALLERWTVEIAELARHIDALPLPTVDVLHRRLADLRDLSRALGADVPDVATLEQLVALHCGAILRRTEAHR
jgi:hypothetical protein